MKLSHNVKPKEVKGLVADVFYCKCTRFKHILPDILFSMCGADDGRIYEEVDMPWSGSMAVVMEELLWIYVFRKNDKMKNFIMELYSEV